MNLYNPKPIEEIAENCGIDTKNLIPYGRYIAKVDYKEEKERLKKASLGKLVVVTSITPTKSGEGKTCTSIGLTQALGRLGQKVSLCLREPSLGPMFGIKGGATGNNKAQVLPPEEINLHFTGDIHAITSAHNLLASIVDNSFVKGNLLNMDPGRIIWRRALDINDRELRYVILGLKKKSTALRRSTGFIITAASEIMAILALVNDVKELKDCLGNIIVAYDTDGKPVRCKQFNIVGSLGVLLRNAINPNLVQTSEAQPVFVHAGPFANIAHGNNSIIATKLALSVSDIVVTESGFASDLGMEKLFDIVLPKSGISPSAVVLVVSTRALKVHGGIAEENLEKPNLGALEQGFVNLKRHIEIIKSFGIIPVVAINKFPHDVSDELAAIKSYCDNDMSVPVVISDVVAKGSQGGLDLANAVLDNLDNKLFDFKPTYSSDMPVKDKIKHLAVNLYGAKDVEYSNNAIEDIEFLSNNNLDKLPVNIAKTHLSLTHDSKIKGAPDDWSLHVDRIIPAAGAGFLVVCTGNIRLMPGLPEHPAAENISLSDDGEISGLI